jgi:hypothetical protein
MTPLPAINPFLMDVQTDAFRLPEADVPELQRGAFDACKAAVAQASQGRQAASVLVTGAPGTGKTHLLARLRKDLEEGSNEHPEARAFFCYVRLNTTPERLWRHLRRHLVDDLRRVVDNRPYLEWILEQHLSMSLEGKDPAKFLAEKFLDLDANLATILAQYWIGTYRWDAIKWLQGVDLTDSVLNSLGIAPPKEGDDVADYEAEAQEVVLGLCRLIAPRPICYCIDQIDALQVGSDPTSGFNRYGQVMTELHDRCNHLALISCTQPQVQRYIHIHVDSAAYERFAKTVQTISPLSADQAISLIRQRLDAIPDLADLRSKQIDKLWPFREEDIRAVIPIEGWSARKLIVHCRALYDHQPPPPPPTPEEIARYLTDRWDWLVGKYLKEGMAGQEDKTVEDSLANLLLLTAPEWPVQTGKKHRDLSLRFAGEKGALDIVCCSQRNMTSLAGKLKRLRVATEKGGLDPRDLVLVRHPACPISPTALRAQEHWDHLRASGARVVQPADATYAALAALRDLMADALSCDLSVQGETLVNEVVLEWLRRKLAPELQGLMEDLLWLAENAPTAPHPLADALISYLEDRLIARLDDAAAHIKASAEDLAVCVQQHGDRFQLLDGQPAVLYRYLPKSGLGDERP